MILLGGSCVSSYGQLTRRYSGPFQVGSYHGLASFSYYTSGSDTIFNGPFQLQHSDVAALLSKSGDRFFQFKGEFDRGTPTGDWKFDFGKYKAVEGSSVQDHQYLIKTDGIRNSAFGTLVNGKVDGKWILSTEKIDSSEVEDILFRSEIDYENGVPQQGFRIRNSNLTLLGRFLREGVAHDEWDLYADELRGLRERWFFDNGKLNQIIIFDGKNEYTVNIYQGELENELTVSLDDRYIRLLKAMRRLNGRKDSIPESKMKNLLEENVNHYQKIDLILNELGSSDFIPTFKVKVDYFPLTTEEVKQVAEIRKMILGIDKKQQDFEGDTQLQLLKLTDEEVAAATKAIDAIHQDLLSPTRALLRFRRDSILSYLKRDSLILQLVTDETELHTVSISASLEEEQDLTLAALKEYSFDESGIAGFVELTREASHTLDSLIAVLDERLVRQERQAELDFLENELLYQADSLTALIDSLLLIEGTSESSFNTIKSYTTTQLKHYSTIERVQNKIDTAAHLVTCFKEMIALSYIISDLPAEWIKIQELYSDRVWNPFTATLMDEEVKRRIPSSYKKTLIPFYLGKLDSELTCGNADGIIQLFDQTHQRMMELREEDTSKLERRLKRKNDPLEIMQLFGIEPIKIN